MTSLRRHHRELVALLLVGGSIILAAGNAEAAVTAPTHDGVAGIGIQSVP